MAYCAWCPRRRGLPPSSSSSRVVPQSLFFGKTIYGNGRSRSFSVVIVTWLFHVACRCGCGVSEVVRGCWPMRGAHRSAGQIGLQNLRQISVAPAFAKPDP
ncbi:hypothetical protein K505DRAFT_125243 [Melanomma pulvis-pyrius CBS 109.77]|uniref:Uncharacterized protein n=1 Tax=Melanomma pulvis-pyrius CBS 109.77 TaxID=1314802 RepID=A0A6A6WUD0_9PLEO|nr:hypothetical protein K505DRAFT_125243 [Melanomma pulvis-pyrius CBS 109.77]